MGVSRIEASLTASHLMNQIPGLRHRVEEALGGAIETAVEFARLHGQELMGSASSPMRLILGNWVIWYYLDAARASAKVVYIEMLPIELHTTEPATEPTSSAAQDEPDDGTRVA